MAKEHVALTALLATPIFKRTSSHPLQAVRASVAGSRVHALNKSRQMHTFEGKLSLCNDVPPV